MGDIIAWSPFFFGLWLTVKPPNKYLFTVTEVLVNRNWGNEPRSKQGCSTKIDHQIK